MRQFRDYQPETMPNNTVSKFEAVEDVKSFHESKNNDLECVHEWDFSEPEKIVITYEYSNGNVNRFVNGTLTNVIPMKYEEYQKINRRFGRI
jgi:hypothetical protein